MCQASSGTAHVAPYVTVTTFPTASRAHLRRAGPDSRDVKREKRARPIAGKMNAKVARRRRPGPERGTHRSRCGSFHRALRAEALRRAELPRPVAPVTGRVRCPPYLPGAAPTRAVQESSRAGHPLATQRSQSRALATLASLARWRFAPPLSVIFRGKTRQLSGGRGRSRLRPGCGPQLAGSTVAYYECCRGPTAPWQETSGTRISRHLLCEADDGTSI